VQIPGSIQLVLQQVWMSRRDKHFREIWFYEPAFKRTHSS